MDVTAGAQLMSCRGWAQTAEFRARPWENVRLSANYFGVVDCGLRNRAGVRVPQGGHRSQVELETLLAGGWRAVADINQLTSLTFRLAFAETFGEAVNAEVRSAAFLTNNFRGFSLNFGALNSKNFLSLPTDTASATDVALLLQLIAGPDPLDETTVQGAVLNFTRALRRPLRRVRLGRPREYYWERLYDEVRRLAEAAAQDLERQGAVIEEVSLPHLYDSDEPSTCVALAEARAFHPSAGWFPARAADYSEEVRARLEMGANIRAIDYLHASTVRLHVQADFARAFERVDAVLAPTVPLPTPRIREERVPLGGTKSRCAAPCCA